MLVRRSARGKMRLQSELKRLRANDAESRCYNAQNTKQKFQFIIFLSNIFFKEKKEKTQTKKCLQPEKQNRVHLPASSFVGGSCGRKRHWLISPAKLMNLAFLRAKKTVSLMYISVTPLLLPHPLLWAPICHLHMALHPLLTSPWLRPIHHSGGSALTCYQPSLPLRRRGERRGRTRLGN